MGHSGTRGPAPTPELPKPFPGPPPPVVGIQLLPEPLHTLAVAGTPCGQFAAGVLTALGGETLCSSMVLSVRAPPPKSHAG